LTCTCAPARQPIIDRFAAINLSAAGAADARAIAGRLVERHGPVVLAAGASGLVCATGTELGASVAAEFAAAKAGTSGGELDSVRDFVCVASVGAGTRACVIACGLARSSRVHAGLRDGWIRVSAHMVRAMELRARFANEQASGVLPAAQAQARLRARAAIAAMDDGQTGAPAGTLAAASGFSVIDHFQRESRRYVIARADDSPRARFAQLTPRERQVAGQAARGLANKVIAFDLGLSTSTVGVLLSRAARKLGVRSRKQLMYVVATFGASGVSE
jgi:DNA-binding CsgD family transcriptional regulator